MIRIYNTLSETKEPLPDSRPLKIFVCGLTVYDHPHIGNGRTFMAFDMIVHYLRSRGIEVFYLQNITDIDDKIIARAAETGVDWKELAHKFETAYFDNLKELGMNAISQFARATDHIPEILQQVQVLIDKGHVYRIEDDGWYFDLSTFPDYGKLAHRTADQAEDATSRVDESIKKRNKGDFCVWKFSKPGEPVWDAAIGAGRPGWHIEDTAITEHFFGPQYDIHGGAVDLKFPHHEAEIAQQESASGKKPLVKIWMHAGFLLVGGKRMGKSNHNFITMQDLLARYSPQVFRMVVAMHHYRSPLDWTEEVAAQAASNLSTFLDFKGRLNHVRTKGSGLRSLDARSYSERFHAAMSDDLNTPQAFGALFDMLNEANQDLWQLSPTTAEALLETLDECLQSLGFDLKLPTIPPEVLKLAEERELMRGNKQFMQADALRQEIDQLGYRSDDTPLGPFVWLKEVQS